MKGIIYNITEKFLIEKFGEDTFDAIMKTCSLKTKEPFVGPGTYPDEDLIEILTKSAAFLKMQIGEFVKQLGRYSFFKLAERHPVYLSQHTHPKDFLKTVDGVIHVEVRKLYSDTQLPKFTYTEPTPNQLIITYYSKRRMYDFMEGLIQGVGDYFKHPIKISRVIYEKDGVEYADFNLTF